MGYQYDFKNQTGNGWSCAGFYNPNEKKWEKLANSPHDSFHGRWPMVWPDESKKINDKASDNDMFEHMCQWEDKNYIMACGTKAGPDTHLTDGIVDGHAYTILSCINDAGGTQFDMIKLRNPWGKGGEFEKGQWMDGGPGWKEYPAVKQACKPVKADDGIFWMEKGEFFKHFETIYL